MCFWHIGRFIWYDYGESCHFHYRVAVRHWRLFIDPKTIENVHSGEVLNGVCTLILSVVSQKKLSKLSIRNPIQARKKPREKS